MLAIAEQGFEPAMPTQIITVGAIAISLIGSGLSLEEKRKESLAARARYIGMNAERAQLKLTSKGSLKVKSSLYNPDAEAVQHSVHSLV